MSPLTLEIGLQTVSRGFQSLVLKTSVNIYIYGCDWSACFTFVAVIGFSARAFCLSITLHERQRSVAYV